MFSDADATLSSDHSQRSDNSQYSFNCPPPPRSCILCVVVSVILAVAWMILALVVLYAIESDVLALHSYTSNAFDTIHGDSLSLSDKLSALQTRLDIQHMITTSTTTDTLLEQRQIYNITSAHLLTLSRQMQNIVDVGNRNVDKFEAILRNLIP